MPKVANLTDKGVTLLRFRSLPNSSEWINPEGQKITNLPVHVAYSDQAKALALQNILKIEGFPNPNDLHLTVTPTDKYPASDTVLRVGRRKKKAVSEE